jgi:hypothetical protein
VRNIWEYLCETLSGSQNTVMDLNNVMTCFFVDLYLVEATSKIQVKLDFLGKHYS